MVKIRAAYYCKVTIIWWRHYRLIAFRYYFACYMPQERETKHNTETRTFDFKWKEFTQNLDLNCNSDKCKLFLQVCRLHGPSDHMKRTGPNLPLVGCFVSAQHSRQILKLSSSSSLLSSSACRLFAGFFFAGFFDPLALASASSAALTGKSVKTWNGWIPPPRPTFGRFSWWSFWERPHFLWAKASQ